MARSTHMIPAFKLTHYPSSGLYKLAKTCKFPIKNFRRVIGWGYTPEEAHKSWQEAHREMTSKYLREAKKSLPERLGEAGAVQEVKSPKAPKSPSPKSPKASRTSRTQARDKSGRFAQIKTVPSESGNTITIQISLPI